MTSLVRKGFPHYLVVSVVVLFLQFGASILLARILGPANLGHILVVNAVLTSVTPLAMFCMDIAITRYVATARGPSEVRTVYTMCLTAGAIASVLIALVVSVVMLVASPLKDATASAYLVYLVWLLVPLHVAQATLALVRGLKRVRQLSVLTLATRGSECVLKTAGATGGLLGWAIGRAVPSVAGGAALLWSFRQYVTRSFNGPLLKEILRFCAFATAANLLYTLTRTFGPLCTDSLLARPEELGYLSVATMLGAGSAVVTQSLETVMFPYISAQSKDLDYIWRNLWRALIRIGGLYGAGAGVGILILPWAIPLIWGERFRPAVPVAQVTCAVIVLRALASTSSIFVTSLGRTDRTFVLTVISVGIVIPSTIFLVGRYGIVGVPVAQAVAAACNLVVTGIWWKLWHRQWVREGWLK